MTVLVPVPRAQQRLWLADQLTSDNAVYLSSNFLRLRGQLSVDALRHALTRIVTRHEVLRTSMSARDGGETGVLHSPEELQLDIGSADEATLDTALRAVASTPMDITSAMPVRARLLRLTDDDHVLCLTTHHVATDRGSVRVLYRELAAFYNEALCQRPSGLPERLRQFRDIAAHYDALFDEGGLAAQTAERRAALAGLSPFELCPDHPRPRVRQGEGMRQHAFDLPPVVVRKLVQLAGSRRATLFMVLLAGCETVLYRYTGRTDVATGTSISTRHDAGSEAVIGPFLNMAVLPADLSGNPAFADLVSRTRGVALDAYESRLVPFDSLVADLGVQRDPARTPLFQILIDFIMPVARPDLAGLRVDEIGTPGSGAKYDLSLDFQQRGDELRCFVEWDTALYERETVARVTAHLSAVLQAAAEDPSRRIGSIPMLAAHELSQLRGHDVPEPADIPARCLHELFAGQAARTPDAVAIQDPDGTVSYAELYERATRIADALAARGAGPDKVVGVLLDRSADLVAVLLGILKAGGAYLPLDPEAPPALISRQLAKAAAIACIVPEDGSGTLPEDAPCPALDIGTLLRSRQAGARTGTVRPDHSCAVYFTSGSTGQPKAVCCTHRGWAGQVADMQRRYRLGPGDTVLLKTPPSFDDVAREIFWPLATGARLAVLPPGLHRDPRAIIDAAAEHGVVWLQFVPSMLDMFLAEVGSGQARRLHRLRDVVSDGDRLRPRTVRLFFDRLGETCRLNNHWGTTEVSIDSTHHICTRDDGDDDGRDAVALGTAMESHSVHVLGPDMEPAPFGAVGDLYLGGAGLARGYLGEPGRTARVFVPHPWRHGERLYRTGDTGRMRPDRSVEYQGRRDHQVKIRGIRIEPGEVEVAVRAFPGVTDAIVTSWEPVPGDCRLVAYAEYRDTDDQTTRSRLRDFLSGRLAPAAVPSAIILLPRLPRLPSGKADRRSLPRPDPEELSDEPFVAPATDAEVAVARIWSAVLGVSRVGATDDFFALGGHSLLVMRAVNWMRDAFAVDISVRLVFEHPTVRAAAARIGELILAEIESMSDAEAEGLASAEGA